MRESTGGCFHILRIFPRDDLVKIEGVERTDEATKTEEPLQIRQAEWSEEPVMSEGLHSRNSQNRSNLLEVLCRNDS